MTIRHIRFFVAVCEAGGVTRAAEALHVAQPVVSTAIAELEKYYGIRLFERINQRLVITEEGKRLLVKARDALAGFEDFEALAKEGSERLQLRLGATLTIGRTRLPKLLCEIREKYPEVDLRVRVDNATEIEQALREGQLDLGLVEGMMTAPGIRAEVFDSDRLLPVCAAEDALPASLSVTELAHTRLLLREPGSSSRELIDHVFAAHREKPEPVMISVSPSVLIAAASAGFGVTILPEGLVAPAIERGELRALPVADADFTREYYLVTHRGKRFSAAGRRVLAFLRPLLSATGEPGTATRIST